MDGGGARGGPWKLEFYVCKGRPLLQLLEGVLGAKGCIRSHGSPCQCGILLRSHCNQGCVY